MIFYYGNVIRYGYIDLRQGFRVDISGIGNRIIELREKKSLSQTELAKRVDINKSVMNRIESEERPIRDYELDKIASVLETSSDYLLGRELEEEKTTYQSQNMQSQVIEALGISDLPFKDVSKLAHIRPGDRQEIINYIQYVIQRAAEREEHL